MGFTSENIDQKSLRKRFFLKIDEPQLYNELISRQCMNIALIMFGITVVFLKISLLLHYLQLFIPMKDYSFMALLTYAAMWTISVFHLVIVSLLIFPCSPREKHWNPFIVGGHCLNLIIAKVTASSINCVSDFVILSLPQTVIWKLQMPFRKRLRISFIFLVGLL